VAARRIKPAQVKVAMQTRNPFPVPFYPWYCHAIRGNNFNLVAAEGRAGFDPCSIRG